jgi:hypothetical protein
MKHVDTNNFLFHLSVPSGSYVVGYDYNIHSTIQYHCDPGHMLRGDPVLTCLDTGYWSGESPYCECNTIKSHYFLTKPAQFCLAF